MDNLDLISNDELRRRLVQYGFQNLPVTQTTRKVLIKKLRIYMEGEKNKVRRQTTNVTKYSSEEESSDREKSSKTSTTRRGGGGRASIAATGITTNSMPPPLSSSTVGSNTITAAAASRRSINSGSQLKNKSPASVSQQRHHHHNNHHHQQQESDEDSSSSDTGNNYSAASLNSSSFNNNYIGGTGGVISASSTRISTGSGYGGTPSPIRTGETTNTYNDYNRPISGRVSIGGGARPSAYQSNISPTITLPNLYNRSPNNYQHYYGGGSGGDLNASPSTSVADSSNGHSAENSPYLSDFTKRLLNLRGTTVPESNSHRAEVFRPITAKLGSPTQRYLSDAGGNTLPGDCFNINQNSGGIVHSPRPRLTTSTPSSPPPSALSSSSSRLRQHNIATTQAASNSNNKISGGTSISKKISNFLIKLDDQYGGVKQTFVPCCLLSVLMVFFALVVIMYLTISPDIASTVNRVDTEFTLCGPGFVQDDSNLMTCIYEDHLTPALDLLKTTAKELQRRVEANRCTDSSIPFSMSSNEVIKLAIAKNPERNIAATMEHLRGMEYLIHMNPKWRIQQCDIAGNTLNYNEVRNIGFDKYFAILNPRLPFTCSLYNKMQRFFITVGTIALVVFVGFLSYYGYWMLRAWRQARRDKVNTLIADIIQALMEKSSDALEDTTQSSSVVVNHLKNQLIPLAERSQMEWVWKEAIEFLERNESRIQFEIGNRSGEDFQMMRWIDTATAPLSSLSAAGNTSGGGSSSLNSRQSSRGSPTTVKKWQSPAFDKTNKIKDPPTQCLKIRQMFDKYEATNPKLKQIIQDSILEKTGPNCKIYDIQLEPSSCCVYVRCATPADAGIVHEQINGWWFDSRLVSIKFLRLDRYLARFPQSLAGPKCLRPSNTKNLSMSNCDKDEQSTAAAAAAAASASRRNGSKIIQTSNRNSDGGGSDNDDYYEDDDDGNNEY